MRLLEETTHIRLSKTKTHFNYFKRHEDGWMIFNTNRWEPYKGNTNGFQLLVDMENQSTSKYPALSPTANLLSSVDHHIPATVLQQLVDIYSNPELDRISLHLNLKYEKDITLNASSRST